MADAVPRLESVCPDFLKEYVPTFHVSCRSSRSRNEDMIGLVVYELNGLRDFILNNVHVKAGYIFFRPAREVAEVPVTAGVAMHERLFSLLFQRKWSDLGRRMTIGGVSRQKGVWVGRSATFNENMDAKHMIKADIFKAMSPTELNLVTACCETFISSGKQTVVNAVAGGGDALFSPCLIL
jgi:hypothetical protein